MKKLATTLALVALCASSALAANAVRISQVYGGGGGSTGTYLRDYVELFNSSNSPVNIGGWVLEYGSATGNWGSSAGNIFTFPVGATIQPCSYLLIEAGAPGTAGVALPVTADYSTTTTGFSMSATGGKVALFTVANANVACGSEASGSIVDKVSYGASTNCSETSPMSGLSSTQGGIRNNGGMTDTDNNSADFTVVLNPVPHNSASAPNPACVPVPTQNNTWGSIKSMYR